MDKIPPNPLFSSCTRRRKIENKSKDKLESHWEAHAYCPEFKNKKHNEWWKKRKHSAVLRKQFGKCSDEHFVCAPGTSPSGKPQEAPACLELCTTFNWLRFWIILFFWIFGCTWDFVNLMATQQRTKNPFSIMSNMCISLKFSQICSVWHFAQYIQIL